MSPPGGPTAGAVRLYARATECFDQRVALAVLRLQQASAVHPGRIVLATSLGAEDMVLTDLIARHRIPVALATLDTGQLHAQTLALLPAIEARYGLKVERWQPQPEQTIPFVRSHGELAMRRSVALRKACCAMRKLEPLSRLLAGRSAWITGLRREQSDARAEVPYETADEAGRTKYSPLVDWSQHDVWQHIALNDVPYNVLHDHFFPSIGCQPCTRAVALGENIRAGRWWWENEDAKECGLHMATSAMSSIGPAEENRA
ncbi:MAG: phosphoadenylyl-sulfate reductase [Rubrivivax sp.]|nr:phosphoadenylyl-sulfate reductase [Rubrivivax sp.]